MQFRNEFKYICNNTDLLLLENKINKVLELDKHTVDGKYIIHSLYFDDMSNTCMNDNDAGLGRRYKYRIRYYDNDLTYVCLEKKEKINGLGRKLTCQISTNEYNDIINGNISKVFWNTGNDLLKKFCVDIQNRLFVPRVIIDYERTAYVEPITNVRITFDKNISGSIETSKFLKGNYTKYPLQDKDKHILEVKFDSIFPGYIRNAITSNKLNQTTFSKYYLSRAILERN